jgi:hypothetical protein
LAPYRNSHFYTNALALYSDTSPVSARLSRRGA